MLRRKPLHLVLLALVVCTLFAVLISVRRDQQNQPHPPGKGADTEPLRLALLPCDAGLVPTVARESLADLVGNLAQIEQFTLNRPLFPGGMNDMWLDARFGQASIDRVAASIRFGRLLTLLHDMPPDDRVALLSRTAGETFDEYAGLYQQLFPFDLPKPLKMYIVFSDEHDSGRLVGLRYKLFALLLAAYATGDLGRSEFDALTAKVTAFTARQLNQLTQGTVARDLYGLSEISLFVPPFNAVLSAPGRSAQAVQAGYPMTTHRVPDVVAYYLSGKEVSGLLTVPPNQIHSVAVPDSCDVSALSATLRTAAPKP